MTAREAVRSAALSMVFVLGALGAAHGQNIESSVQVIEGLEPVHMEYGQYTLGAALETVGDHDRYTFFGEVGDVVDLNLTNLGSQELWIQLRSPTGQVVVTNWYDSGGAEFRTRATLSERGDHVVIVREYHSNETGEYMLQLERLPALLRFPEQQRLYYGAAEYFDTISPWCDTDFFVFEALPGSTIRVLLRVFDSWEGYLEIWSPSGERMVRNWYDSGGADFATDWTVPASAPGSTYYVAVSEYHLNETGGYAISLECLSGPCPPIDEAVYQIVPAGPNCVDVRLINNVSTIGGELRVGYDSSKIAIGPGDVTAIRGAGGLPDAFDIDPTLGISLAGCPADPDIDTGISINWLDAAAAGDALTPARRDILRICYTPLPGVANGDCSPIKFLTCSGDPGSPVQNLITHSLGGTVIAQTVDGSTCSTVGTAFRRGDANGDRQYDVSDPIAILICLFLERGCTRCLAASDANDDGTIDTSDASYLINWRFHGGPPPEAPFPGCGADPTSPSTELCIEPACP